MTVAWHESELLHGVAPQPAGFCLHKHTWEPRPFSDTPTSPCCPRFTPHYVTMVAWSNPPISRSFPGTLWLFDITMAAKAPFQFANR